MIFGGVTPANEELTIKLDKELGVTYFLERRELGIINIGGEGSVVLDGEELRCSDETDFMLEEERKKYYSAQKMRTIRLNFISIQRQRTIRIQQ